MRYSCLNPYQNSEIVVDYVDLLDKLDYLDYLDRKKKLWKIEKPFQNGGERCSCIFFLFVQ